MAYNGTTYAQLDWFFLFCHSSFHFSPYTSLSLSFREHFGYCADFVNMLCCGLMCVRAQPIVCVLEKYTHITQHNIKQRIDINSVNFNR